MGVYEWDSILPIEKTADIRAMKMVNEVPHGPECNAPWQEGQTCQDHFHQMLFWENEHPPLGEVHHLMVLCYHLQHPSLYAPEGLEYAKGLLVDFIERGL